MSSICRYHLAGSCRFGNNCRYVHQMPSSSRSSYSSPLSRDVNFDAYSSPANFNPPKHQARSFDATSAYQIDKQLPNFSFKPSANKPVVEPMEHKDEQTLHLKFSFKKPGAREPEHQIDYPAKVTFSFTNPGERTTTTIQQRLPEHRNQYQVQNQPAYQIHKQPEHQIRKEPDHQIRKDPEHPQIQKDPEHQQFHNDREHQQIRKKVEHQRELPNFSFKPKQTIVQRKSNDDFEADDKGGTSYADVIQRDMVEWENSTQWPFSSYSCAKNAPSIAGFNDVSFEELRLKAVDAKRNGTMESYVEDVKRMYADFRKTTEKIKHLTPEQKKILNERVKEKLSPASRAKTPPSTSTPSKRNSVDAQAELLAENQDGSRQKAAQYGSRPQNVFLLKHRTYSTLDELTNEEIRIYQNPTEKFQFGMLPAFPPTLEICRRNQIKHE